MTSWITLFIKEFRAARIWFYFNVLVILLGASSLFFLNETQILLYSLLVMILFHVIYLPVWVVYSIFVEWKNKMLTHWLNLPHSGLVLVTSKFAAGIAMMIISLLVCNGVLALLYSYILEANNDVVIQAVHWFISEFWVILLGTMIMAILSGSQVMCAIIIGKSVTRFRLLLVAGFLLIPGLFQALFHETAGYSKLVSWGMLTSAVTEWIHPILLNQHDMVHTINVLSELTIFSLGTMFVQLIYSIMLVWISSRLVDRALQI
ncbi:hypothetical protein JCM10914A_28970 [Paenibacillus sp. JCM 10914]|uniref:hypothetical protein n=1 Tax=Paenibacillus sp. JCM 10914 TaxID=1236974 RepID=UPI00055FBB7E|nr:hypothetical protein [Paenibacillus sp. JCM 10914]